MAANPQLPPEAVLINSRVAAMVPVPSRAELARRAGISATLWAQVSNGYTQPAPGIRAPSRGSALTIAKMASVARITPAELRLTGRGDAADILATLPELESDLTPDEARGIREQLAELRRAQERMNEKLDQLLGTAPQKRPARL